MKFDAASSGLHLLRFLRGLYAPFFWGLMWWRLSLICGEKMMPICRNLFCSIGVFCNLRRSLLLFFLRIILPLVCGRR